MTNGVWLVWLCCCILPMTGLVVALVILNARPGPPYPYKEDER
jgi:hypothetical protein